MCPGFLGIQVPCMFLYSRIDSEHDVLYSVSVMVFLFFTQVVSAIIWIREWADGYKDDFDQGSKDIIISQMFFNAPNFSIKTKFDMENLQNVSHNVIFTEIKEDTLIKKIKERTPKEWRMLYIRRVILMIINLIGIGILCFIIVYTNVNKIKFKNYLQATVAQYDLFIDGKQFADLSPTLVVTICNKLIPPFIKKITENEKWDYQHQVLNQQIWRIWMGRMLNLFIFVCIQSQLASNVEIFIPQSQIKFNGGGVINFQCREDEAAMNII